MLMIAISEIEKSVRLVFTSLPSDKLESSQMSFYFEQNTVILYFEYRMIIIALIK